ncbi:MAG: ABC transporter ATP-binding protein [Gammaproteobacteria bacterium]|nr:ABC transporter ATP-binding protein [Gammaproteobacteria bacterium]
MLILDSVNCYYDDVQVLRDFSLEVRGGEVMCLLGRNGAGKSTTMKAIMGLASVRSGSITLQLPEGHVALHELPAHRIPVHGIGYVPQGRRLFSDLTVAENLLIGQQVRTLMYDQHDRIFGYFPVLKERLKQKAGTLSGGEQQMLAIARALSLDPDLLLLDEPTEGLQPSMIQNIREVVADLGKSGVTTIIVEQRVDAIKSIADRVTFIENGQNRDTVSVQTLSEQPELVHRYVGVGH